ncbi:hypothetical protein GCM10011585_05310 [Edaphobacter dinghuensis]|uniref:Uncharacterized protein n=1 Tax=Edaphobacter dinghuensis TaxID=1560005 RepID=A0A917H3I1_9BACT|nr:hypothetical protein GCM10011585_05310 [Edaphobacter dinghuensis]
MLHLQKVIRGSLDMLPYLVTVCGPIQKRPQNKHVQRALEQVCALRCLFRHRRQSTLDITARVDIRLSTVKG